MLQRHTRVELDRFWKYHPGDNPAWSAREFDDSTWENAATSLHAREMPQNGWTGVGWFRMHLEVDATLWQQSLGLVITQAGATSIHIDGRLVYEFGHDGLRQLHPVSEEYLDYTALWFTPQRHHVIAVRYANHAATTFHQAGLIAGFNLFIGQQNSILTSGMREMSRDLITQILFTTFALAFCLLHLVLFIFSPHAKSHLYFALFVFFYAGNIFFDYEAFLATHLRDLLQFLRLHRAIMPISPIFMLLFLYSLFTTKIPKHFWFIVLGLVVTGFFAVLRPLVFFNYVFIFVLAILLESVRVLRAAVRAQHEGAWIIVTGFLLLGLFSSYDLLLDLNMLAPMNGIQNGYTFGFLGLMFAMSIYLARDFAQTNAKMLAHERAAREQEIQRRLLQADHARKTRELEEARKLQLSMLPKAIPQPPHIDIAVYTKPATEVGGDYYDFHSANDGSLTVALGDATGHGAKAGIMVATMKSIFTAGSFDSDLAEFLHKSAHILKQMNLGNLYMAMTLLQLKADRIRIASAGMPPVLLHRAARNEVEEFVMKTMPLGAPTASAYQQRDIAIAPGDTILMMTDGYAELFNEQEEMLDYPNVIANFKQVANQPPADIIAHLLACGKKWQQGRVPHDDITFVVLKTK